MLVYMHCDGDCRITAYGFKSARSASNYIVSRMKELAAFQKSGRYGSVQEAVPQHVLTEIEKLATSVKGNAESIAATLQQAIDLYEGCIVKSSVSHLIKVVDIVS